MGRVRAGIDNGATLRMAGLGGQVPREFGGHGEPGDLLLQVRAACLHLGVFQGFWRDFRV